jgi:hypothetical protein
MKDDSMTEKYCEKCGLPLIFIDHWEPDGDQGSHEPYWECPNGCDYPEEPIPQWEKDFDKWAQETTADFRSDGEDEYNVEFSELAFYDELKAKIREIVRKETA